MSFYTSLSGLQASQTEMNTISHNLANVATNGFKKQPHRVRRRDRVERQRLADQDGRVGRRR